jgi:hypothetical protein
VTRGASNDFEALDFAITSVPLDVLETFEDLELCDAFTFFEGDTDAETGADFFFAMFFKLSKVILGAKDCRRAVWGLSGNFKHRLRKPDHSL